MMYMFNKTILYCLLFPKQKTVKYRDMRLTCQLVIL